MSIVQHACADIPLPQHLKAAVVSRQCEFRCGRHLAREALRRLECDTPDDPIAIGPNGCPAWPEGFVGSISHKRDVAIAAVCHCRDARGVGVDLEHLMDDARARRVARKIVTAAEEETLTTAGGQPFAHAVTLAFSAKEAVYKALFPMTARYLGFHDVEIDMLDADSASFTARVLDAASAAAAGGTIRGRFALADDVVFTGVVLPQHTA